MNLFLFTLVLYIDQTNKIASFRNDSSFFQAKYRPSMVASEFVEKDERIIISCSFY